MRIRQTGRRPLRNQRAKCMMKSLQNRAAWLEKITNLTYLFPLES